MKAQPLGSENATAVSRCRACRSSSLIPLFSLGALSLCNAFPLEGEEPARIPLDVLLCDPRGGGCGLVQLRHSTSTGLLYTRYWYQSAISSTMREHLATITKGAENLVPLASGDVVLDIGCNDGTLLRSYVAAGIRRIGFEPNQLHERAKGSATTIVNDFFSAAAFRVTGAAPAKIVTSIAMFYDLDDPGTFADDVRECLADDGIWIVEMHHLPAMLETNGFDAIVHEHVAFYSMTTLQRLLAARDFEIFDVELNGMNGGSFRTFIRRQGAPVREPAGAAARVESLARREADAGLTSVTTYERFMANVNQARDQLRAFVTGAVSRGERVCLHGASTKGNALLQYYGLDNTVITAAADLNADKWGRRTPGTGIPIMRPEDVASLRPRYVIVPIWHLLDEVQRFWAQLDPEAALIAPLPAMRVLEPAGTQPVGP